MRLHHIELVALAFLLLGSSTTARAESVQAEFDRMFGESIRSATASADLADDQTVARRLLDATLSLKDSLELAELCYLNAYNLGIKSPSGHTTAIDAMIWLARVSQAKRREAHDKLIAIHQLRYQKASIERKNETGRELMWYSLQIADYRASKGDFDDALRIYRRMLPVATAADPNRRDNMQGTVKTLTQLSLATQKAPQLEAKLKSTPDDAATHRALGLLYLHQLNQLDQAAPHLLQSGDDSLAALGEMLLRQKSWGPRKVLKYGRYCFETARTAEPGVKPLLLLRARLAFNRYLYGHRTKDKEQLEVETTQTHINTELEKAPAPNFISLDAAKLPPFRTFVIRPDDPRPWAPEPAKEPAAEPTP